MGFDRFHSWICAPHKAELVIGRLELASVSSYFLTFAMMMIVVIDQLSPWGIHKV